MRQSQCRPNRLFPVEAIVRLPRFLATTQCFNGLLTQLGKVGDEMAKFLFCQRLVDPLGHD